ncbi:hemerythrin domain-containing protein [Cognatishimia sp. SS12]|uniref:hemerythrin domain-containing protein n=1 Tax=Cognatishimia sp. SS12 TaxID=2979465 RepID=UPI00232B9D77|nr:hemerythrin domain-containing protein [Cognatishimia sp. SS12]
MTQYDINVRQGLPEEMQLLLREYPRDAWPDHPNFATSIRNWMGAHGMFRQLAELIVTDTQALLDKASDPTRYASRLGHFGNLLVRNLHGHHGWEDHRFFPELEAADGRFARGLEMLESDHLEMDQRLESFTRASNRYLQLMDLSPKDAEAEIGAIQKAGEGIERFLERHLSDEEDLVVPILLHHKMRG